jgi:hypothetical protein
VADFLGISSLGTGSVDGKLVGIPEEFKDFTSMFTLEYDSIKENLKDKDGNPISLEEYLNELHTYGEFDNKMDKPFLEFVSCILDVTMLKPLIEMCWGYDLITGENLSDFERGMKGVFAVIDVVSLMIGIKASGVVKIFSKNTLKLAGKSVLLDAFGGAGAYGIGQIGQELELPLPITLLMSMGAGIGIVKVGGRYLFKDQAGNVLLDVAEKDVDALRKGVSGVKQTSAFGEMSLEDGARYSQYWDDVVKGVDTDARIKLNQWGRRPDADLYKKYKNVYDNSKYYNQQTGDIHWPIDDGFISGSQKLEVVGKGKQLDRYGNQEGKFLAPKADSYPSRSLAPHSENAPYYAYEVTTDIEMTLGKIAPWFEQPGGGTQYVKYKANGDMYSIQELINEGYLIEIK